MGLESFMDSAPSNLGGGEGRASPRLARGARAVAFERDRGWSAPMSGPFEIGLIPSDSKAVSCLLSEDVDGAARTGRWAGAELSGQL